MSIVAQLIARDLRRAYRHGGMVLPVLFFLLVAVLYPFGVGPDGPLLSRTGGAILWIAALLAALLPIEQLIAGDADQGFLDQLAVRGISEEIVVLARLAAHWLAFGPPLLVAVIPAAALLRLENDSFWRVELGLAIGTPGLAALSVMIAAITAGLRGAGALSGILMLPLAIPLLIFGAGSLDPASGSALKLLAACSLFAVALAPFVAGAAIRAGRE